MKCSSSLTVPKRLLFSNSRKGRNLSRHSCEEELFRSTVFLRKFKLIQTFVGACFHQVLCNHLHRSLDLPVHVKVFVVHKAVQSLSAVLSFDLREASFNRVEFRTIANVLNLNDVKFLVALDNFFRFVNTELIHEDSKASVSVYLP
jgi:hypothetical protein